VLVVVLDFVVSVIGRASFPRADPLLANHDQSVEDEDEDDDEDDWGGLND
jgi:hypothetical protein